MAAVLPVGRGYGSRAGTFRTVAGAAAAAAAAADSAQWLSVKEETIFLHDGLIRVTDLAELPSEILGAPEAADTDLEVSEAAPWPPPSD